MPFTPYSPASTALTAPQLTTAPTPSSVSSVAPSLTTAPPPAPTPAAPEPSGSFKPYVAPTDNVTTPSPTDQMAVQKLKEQLHPGQQEAPHPLDSLLRGGNLLPTFVPATGEDGAMGTFAHSAANLVPSGVNFVKGIADFLNPIENVKKFGEAVKTFATDKDAGDANYQKPSALDIVKQAPHAVAGMIPDFYHHLAAGDIEKAKAAFENDPVGTVAPLLIVAHGAAEKAGAGEAFRQSISDTLEKGVAPVNSVVDSIKTGAEKIVPTVLNTPKIDPLAQLVQTVDESRGNAAGQRAADKTTVGRGLLAKEVVLPSEKNVATAEHFKDYLVPNDPTASGVNLDQHFNDLATNVVRPFLQEHPAIFNGPTLRSYLETQAELKPLNFTANDGENVYGKVIDTMMKEVKKNPQQMEGLWDSRIGFDNAVKEQFKNAFEGNATATKQAIWNIRQAVNEYIASKTGGAGDNTFTEAMKEMSETRKLSDNLYEKSQTKLGKTKIEQAIKAHPIVTKAVKTAGTIVGAGEAMKHL